MELISVILLSIDGTFESLIKNVLFIFGFSDQQTQQSITKDEFQFFLDCMFRGVMSLVQPPKLVTNAVMRKRYKDNVETPYIGRRVDHKSIADLVAEIFPPEITDQGYHDVSSLVQCIN